jgi:recombinational DNA repair protein (RecF pathway)
MLNQCKTCAARADEPTSDWYFSPVDGGIFCGNCAGARKELMPLGVSAVKMLTQLQEEEALPAAPVILPAQVVHEIRTMVSSFLQYHMVREIKSAPFLRSYSPV